MAEGISRDSHRRRNLSDMQRGELAIKLERLIEARAKAKQRASGGAVPKNSAEPPIETREELAKAAGVSHDTITKVKKIIASPVTELARMVRDKKVSINAVHGIRRTNEDKRRAVTTLLRDEEWGKWSSKKVAEKCGVAVDTVCRIRKELSSSLSESESEPRTYTTKHGTTATMNTTNIGKREALPDART